MLRVLFASGKENKFSVGLFLPIKYITNGLNFEKLWHKCFLHSYHKYHRKVEAENVATNFLT